MKPRSRLTSATFALVLGLQGIIYAQGTLPMASSTVTPSSQAANYPWLDDLSSQIQNAPVIHFDATMTIKDGDKPTVSMEVKGVATKEQKLYAELIKNGHITCEVFSDTETAMAYCPVTNRFMSFDPDESLKPQDVADPNTFAKVKLGQFITDQVGDKSEASLNFVLANLKALKPMVLGLKEMYDAPAPLTWTESQTTVGISTVTRQTAVNATTTNNIPVTETVILDYTKSPWSLKDFDFGIASSAVTTIGSGDVVYKKFDISQATTQADELLFASAVPAGALAWIPPK